MTASKARLNGELLKALRLARSYMSDAVDYGSPCAKKDADYVDAVIAAHSAQGAGDGWCFYTADFSSVAAHRMNAVGRVTLVRDVEGRAWWHALDEEGKERESLYVYGEGKTLNEAFENANQKAALAAPTKETP